MVWTGIYSLGRIPLVVIPSGVKINYLTYQNLVLKPIVKDLSMSMFNDEPFLFQQDGASPHAANITHSWLRTEILDYICKEEWPHPGFHPAFQSYTPKWTSPFFYAPRLIFI